jgi:RNA polymerase sigma-70 factor (ECF subfamily)
MPEQTLSRAEFERELVALLPRLRRFAAGLAGTVHDGDDLVQGALTKALSNADRWTPGTRLDSWMYRIIQNHWIDTVRARKTRNDSSELDDADRHVSIDGARAADSAINADRLRKEIERLPPEQRSVLLLVAIEGQSYADAASALGIPVGTVMSRLSRARAALSHSIYGDLGGGDA